MSALPQVVIETCKDTEVHVCTLESRVDALHATMQHSSPMCAENAQHAQQVHQECETIRRYFQDLTTKVAFSFDQVLEVLTRVESETQTL